jgi:hypothetical protein
MSHFSPQNWLNRVAASAYIRPYIFKILSNLGGGAAEFFSKNIRFESRQHYQLSQLTVFSKAFLAFSVPFPEQQVKLFL